jgi:L,D-transpeptidase catalytic domain/Putative peptidoglycan binding domain
MAALFVLGFALAGGFAASVVASTTATTTTGADTGTGGATTTLPVTTTTATTPKPPAVIAARVTIAGVRVGKLTSVQAAAIVRRAFSRPLPLTVAGTRYAPAPARFGAVARIDAAVRAARAASPGTAVPLVVTVDGKLVRAYVAGLAARFNRLPVDSVLSLRHFRPWISKDVPGRALLRRAAVEQIVKSFTHTSRLRARLKFRLTPAAVTRADFGPLIVIERSSNRLLLFQGMHFVRVFPVATGQAIYPTPLGKFSIIVKWVNPWWYPPTQDAWAKGLKPVPPGPNNPLGTRWMGLSAPGVGIHGTDAPSSIGYSASHGCIRMQIPDAEWLFGHVNIGTTVYIVPA